MTTRDSADSGNRDCGPEQPSRHPIMMDVPATPTRLPHANLHYQEANLKNSKGAPSLGLLVRVCRGTVLIELSTLAHQWYDPLRLKTRETRARILPSIWASCGHVTTRSMSPSAGLRHSIKGGCSFSVCPRAAQTRRSSRLQNFKLRNKKTFQFFLPLTYKYKKSQSSIQLKRCSSFEIRGLAVQCKGNAHDFSLARVTHANPRTSSKLRTCRSLPPCFAGRHAGTERASFRPSR